MFVCECKSVSVSDTRGFFGLHGSCGSQGFIWTHGCKKKNNLTLHALMCDMSDPDLLCQKITTSYGLAPKDHDSRYVPKQLHTFRTKSFLLSSTHESMTKCEHIIVQMQLGDFLYYEIPNTNQPKTSIWQIPFLIENHPMQ